MKPRPTSSARSSAGYSMVIGKGTPLPEDARWLAMINYITDASVLPVEHDIEELDTLGTRLGGRLATQSRRRTMPTSWPRGSSPEASHDRLRFNRLTGPGTAEIRQLVRCGEVIE